MKRIVLLVAVSVVTLWGTVALGSGLKVEEAVITTRVVERAPVDQVQTYPSTVGQLYCFTHLTGAEGETSITHVWFFGDQEVSRVTLPVRSANWRTWSGKTILPQWTGEWRVEILDASGEVLMKVPFTLTQG